MTRLLNPAYVRQLARDQKVDTETAGLGAPGLGRLLEFLKGKLDAEDINFVIKLLRAISLDRPTDHPDDPHRDNEAYAGKRSKQDYAGDQSPIDYSWAPGYLREAGMSQSNIDDFVAEAKKRGGIFLPRAGGNQAQDSRNAAAFNKRFPDAARIGAELPYGDKIPAKRGALRGSTEDFSKRFPSAAKIGQV